MGGSGSGGYNGRPRRLKVEDCRRLSIKGLVKDGTLCCETITWRSEYYGDSSIGFEADTRDPYHAFMRLHYGFGEEAVDYRISLSYSRPHYGGGRWWFICPHTGQRVTKLYLPYGGGRRFLSRHAYGLKYRCQGIDAYSRAQRTSQKLQGKVIDGEDGLCYRPKGMHQKTFDRIMDKVDEAEAKADDYFVIRAARFLSRFSLPDLIKPDTLEK